MEAGSGVETKPSELKKHLFETIAVKVGEAAGTVCSRSFDIQLIDEILSLLYLRCVFVCVFVGVCVFVCVCVCVCVCVVCCLATQISKTHIS